MLQDIVTLYAIAGTLTWLIMFNAGFIDRTCADLRYPKATTAMLTIGIVAGWWIVAAVWLQGKAQQWRAGR